MTEQPTQPTPPMVRLHKAAIIMQLLAANPDVAAAPINWEIDDRESGLWPRIAYGIPETETAAKTLAAALHAEIETSPVRGRTMYMVDGHYAGTRVTLHAFGPEHAEAAEVAR